MRSPFPALLLGLTLALPCTGRAQSEPVITVKARSVLTELVTVSRGLRVEVEGNLRDNLGQPVPGETVEVLVEAATSARARTDPQGHFQTTLVSSGSGSRTVTVRYPGGPLLGPTEATAEVSVGRNAVEMSTDLPEAFPAGERLSATITAADARGVPLAGRKLEVHLDETPLGLQSTGPDGTVGVAIASLARGQHRLVATFAGDEDSLPARLERPLWAYVQLAVDLDPLPAVLEPGQRLVATGTVLRAPTEGTPVVLTVDGLALEGTTTGPGGRFRIMLDVGALPVGRVALRAMAAPTEPSLRSAFSAERTLEVLPTPPPSLAWLIGPVAFGALAALGAAWRRRLPTVLPALQPASSPPPPPFQRQKTEARDGRLQVLVRAAVTGLPLQAQVVLLRADEVAATLDLSVFSDRWVSTEVAGTADLAGPGDFLYTEAPGHAPDLHACAVPPGGQVLIHLETIRARIQRRHEETLIAAGRPILRFGRESPAEAATSLVQRGAPQGLVLSFTADVERACFGPDEPDRTLLAAVDRGAELLIRGLDAGRRR